MTEPLRLQSIRRCAEDARRTCSVAFDAVAKSRAKGGIWRTINAQLSQLRCAPIRKQGFRSSGSSDVAVQ